MKVQCHIFNCFCTIFVLNLDFNTYQCLFFFHTHTHPSLPTACGAPLHTPSLPAGITEDRGGRGDPVPEERAVLPAR